MTNQETADALAELMQVDIDAVLAYDRALGALGGERSTVASTLAGFKLDHQRHILDLSELLLGMARTPPAAKPDVKGSILGGVTGLRARLGTEQALQAMKGNERLTTASYARALARPFPENVIEVVRRGAADEQRHLSWIERALDERVWEQDEAASP